MPADGDDGRDDGAAQDGHPGGGREGWQADADAGSAAEYWGDGDDSYGGLSDAEVEAGLAEFDPEVLEGLEGASPAARHGVLSLYRETVAALRERGGRRDASLDDAITVEAVTGHRLQALRIAVEVRRLADERRDAAILAAREVGYGWAELARVVGVSRQALRQRIEARAVRDRQAG